MNQQQTQEPLTLAQRLTAILAEREPETEWPAIAGLPNSSTDTPSAGIDGLTSTEQPPAIAGLTTSKNGSR